MLQIGDVAPDFGLYSTEKKKVSLSDFKGKNVVILFFPLAFTSVCTKELCTVSENLEMYSSLNAEIIGISVDSLYALSIFKKQEQLNITLLSDFNKEVSQAYETIYESFAFEMKGVSKRSAFIIDKDGKIRYAEILENAGEVPNFAAISEVLGTLS